MHPHHPHWHAFTLIFHVASLAQCQLPTFLNSTTTIPRSKPVGNSLQHSMVGNTLITPRHHVSSAFHQFSPEYPLKFTYYAHRLFNFTDVDIGNKISHYPVELMRNLLIGHPVKSPQHVLLMGSSSNPGSVIGLFTCTFALESYCPVLQVYPSCPRSSKIFHGR